MFHNFILTSTVPTANNALINYQACITLFLWLYTLYLSDFHFLSDVIFLFYISIKFVIEVMLLVEGQHRFESCIEKSPGKVGLKLKR